MRGRGLGRGYICGPRDVGVTGAELDRLMTQAAARTRLP